jgi:hypothetical protein
MWDTNHKFPTQIEFIFLKVGMGRCADKYTLNLASLEPEIFTGQHIISRQSCPCKMNDNTLSF